MGRLEVLRRLASRRMLLVVVLCAMALGGCRTSNVLPSVPAVVASVAPFASTGPTGGPDASTSAEPLPMSATTVDAGVRVTIQLDRNPMPAGEPTWITATVANMGDEPIFWGSDCDAAVWVSGPVIGMPWRAGLRQPEPLKTWKAYLLDREGIGGADRVVQFQPKSFVDRGGAACSEVAHIHGLKVRETLVQRARWDGLAFDRLSPPPTAMVDLVGRFVYGRSKDSMRTSTTEVHLRAGVIGGADQLLDPAEAVDIALRDVDLTALLEARELRNGNQGVIRFDPSTGGYVIGIVDSANVLVPRLLGVVVDARTGAMAGSVERTWDPAIDGT